MKTQFARYLLMILVLFSTFSLTACEEADEALMEAAVMAWLGGGPENLETMLREVGEKALEQTVDDVTNSDESVQFDGLDVIEDIEEADNLSDQALRDLDTAAMRSAVNMRPNDWRIQEKDAAVWLANGNGSAAETAFTNSDELLRDSLGQGGDCPGLRTQQLQARKSALTKAEQACSTDPGCSMDEQLALRDQIDVVEKKLKQADSTGIPAFCEDY